LSSKSKQKAIRNRFVLVVTGGYLLTPIIGLYAAVIFNVAPWQTLVGSFATALLPLFIIGMVSWAGFHNLRFLQPVFAWLDEHPGSFPVPDQIQRHLMRFSTDFWGFFLIYALITPQIYFWTSGIAAQSGALEILWQFTVLQLVASILVGLPVYLATMDTLGQLAEFTGLPRVRFSLKSRMLLIGAFIPLLANALALRYFWYKAGFLSMDLVFFLGALGLLSISITVLSIRGMAKALEPVRSLLGGKSPSNYAELATLKAHSVDELGYMTQTIGELFQRLDDQRSLMHATIDTAAEGVIIFDDECAVRTFNPASEMMFGYQAKEIVGHKIYRLLPGIRKISDVFDLLNTENEIDGLYSDGRRRLLSIRINEMSISGERMFTCLLSDITQRNVAETQLKKAEARYRDLVETAHDLVWSVDTKFRWTYLNEASSKIYGYAPREMMNRSISEFATDEYNGRDQAAFADILNGKELVQYETVHIDRNGTPRNISFNAKAHKDEDGVVVRISGTARDITAQKVFEKQLSYQAEHDSLTGLYNRHYFSEELERLVARVARSGANCSLFYIDLDQFKYINDTLGHAAGDRLLLETTEMLRSHVREGDLLARFGGDEFTLLLYNIDEGSTLLAAEDIRSLIEKYTFIESGQACNVTCSIGIAVIDNTTRSSEDVLAHADLACNMAKKRGRNQIYMYSNANDAKFDMAEDMGWAARVREVLENDRFHIVFQPIIAVSDGKVHDYEVLLRMEYDDGQIILPGGFMPAAERFGLINSIDRWTVRESINQLAFMRDEGRDVRFAINLSGRAFEDDSLLTIIKQALAETGLEPSLLTFEITETAAISNLTAATKFIYALKDIGCQFALDDFGSGFCSFTYLKHLPVDKLKIDGSFVQSLASTPVDQAMVRSMNQVAHALGKETIAESVEDAATLDLLKSFGVDFAQGYHIGRPCDELVMSAIA